jgi:hypothetical protein
MRKIDDRNIVSTAYEALDREFGQFPIAFKLGTGAIFREASRFCPS